MSNALPAPQNKKTLNVSDAINADIIDTLAENFPIAVKQTEQFAKQFKGASRRQTAYNVWKLLREHVYYTKDDKDSQLIRLPARFLSDETGDCKSFALTAAALLANNRMPVRFRYANYKPTLGKTPSHVYAVTEDESGKDIIVDGVYSYFDAEKKPHFEFDKPMNVYTLSDEVEDVAALPMAVSLARLRRKKALMKRLHRKHFHFKGRSLSEVIEGIEDCAEVEGIFGKRKKKGNIFKRIGKGIKKVGKKLKKLQPGKLLKKIGLAPGRRAFRTLVSLNANGLAYKLKRTFDKDPKSLENKWKKLGGDMSALKKSIKVGYNHWAKKHKKAPMNGIYGCDLPYMQHEAKSMGLCGTDDGIGVAVAALLAAAAPVLIALLPLLKQHDDGQGAEGGEASSDSLLNMATDAVKEYNAAAYDSGEGAEAMLTTDDPTDPESAEKFATQADESDEPSTNFSLSPIVIIAILFVVFLLFKKK